MNRVRWFIVSAIVITALGAGAWMMRTFRSEQVAEIEVARATSVQAEDPRPPSTHLSEPEPPAADQRRKVIPAPRGRQTSVPSAHARVGRAAEKWSGRPDVVYRPSGRIRGLAFLDGGRQLALAEGGQQSFAELRVVDINSGRTVWRVAEPAGIVQLTRSSDGTGLAVARGDDTILLINAETGRELHRLIGHLETIQDLQFSADGRRLLSISVDHTARIWNCDSGQVEASARIHEEQLASAGFAADGRQCLFGTNRGTLERWIVEGERLVRERALPPLASVRSIAVSPRGTIVASAEGVSTKSISDDPTSIQEVSAKTLRLIDGASGQEVVEFSLERLANGVPDPGTEKVEDVDDDLPAEAEVPGDSRPRGRLSPTVRVRATPLAFSADESRIVVGSPDPAEVTVLSTDAGNAIATLAPLPAAARLLVLSDDGTRIACALEDGSVRTWTTEEGLASERIIIAAADTSTNEFAAPSALAPDGTVAAVALHDGTIEWVELGNPYPIRRLTGLLPAITAVAVSPDGKQVAAGNESGELAQWNTTGSADAAPQLRMRIPDSASVTTIASVAGQWLVGTESGGLHRFDLAGPDPVDARQTRYGTVQAIASAREERSVVAAFADGSVRQFAWPDLHEMRTVVASGPMVQALAWSPSGNLLAGMVDGDRLCVWAGSDRREIASIDLAAEKVPHNGLPPTRVRPTLTFAPSERAVVTSSSLGFRVVDLKTKRVIAHHGTSGPPVAMAVRPSNHSLALVTADRTVATYSPTMTLARRIPAHQGEARFVEISPDGKLLISGGSDKVIHLWDVATAAKLHTFESQTGVVTRGAISPDGRLLVTCGFGSGVEFWDLAKREFIRKLYGHTARVDALAFSPDGQRLATGSWDKTVLIRDSASGRTLVKLPAQELPVTEITWSPDGKYLVTGTSDWQNWHLTGRLRVWLAETGRPFAEPAGPRGSVNAAAFTGDGQLLLTASGDKQLRLWETSRWNERNHFTFTSAPTTFRLFDGGRLVVTSTWPARLCVHDLTTGSLRFDMSAFGSRIYDIAAVPEADWFVTASADGQLSFWTMGDPASAFSQGPGEQ